MLKSDLLQVLAIEEQLFSEPWQASMFAEEIDKHQAWVVLNELQQVVAYLTGWLVVDEFSLNNIGVNPAFHRQKIATKLLLFLIEEIQRRNCRSIFLEVRSSNLAAIQLYEKFKFKIIGKRKKYYHDPVEDALVMKLDLEEK